jgi:phosphatidylserine synthase
MGKILLLVSIFTTACALWLAVMEVLLQHPGHAGRIGIALAVALISAATILVRMLHVGFRGERWLWAGAAALIGLGGEAFLHNARSAHFEGFVFVISLVLVLQGVLMLTTLGRAPGGGARPLDPMTAIR